MLTSVLSWVSYFSPTVCLQLIAESPGSWAISKDSKSNTRKKISGLLWNLHGLRGQWHIFTSWNAVQNHHRNWRGQSPSTLNFHHQNFEFSCLHLRKSSNTYTTTIILATTVHNINWLFSTSSIRILKRLTGELNKSKTNLPLLTYSIHFKNDHCSSFN